ncbi:MAG: hypothetical protein HRT37_18760 [Alteromonadaceae bacterium]|nr:hypothetical protein [Alteromonadaceae bacterium]
MSPNTNLEIGPYQIHHLFTGLLLIIFAGIPLVLFNCDDRLLDFASILFGMGLSMALDEWVYLIVTDGSDSAYLLPVSFWGGTLLVGLVFVYIIVLSLYSRKPTGNKSKYHD